MYIIERDPNNKKLQNEVEKQLQEIYSSFEPKKDFSQKTKNDLKDVSMEDAIKELINMGIKE